MQQSFDPHRPVYDQAGRKAEVISVHPLALEYPIAAMVQVGDGRRTPMSFSRSGVSPKGPQFFLTNSPAHILASRHKHLGKQ